MKYLRHINESNLTKIFKDNIDWNIIDDAKDMSLEYLDENVNNVLIIEIKHEMYSRYMRNNLDSINIYSCTYRYKNLKEDWDHEENLSSSFIEKIDVNNIKYNFYIYEIIEAEYQDVEKIKMEETYEIQERLKSLYHDKINDIIEERNGNYRFARSKPLKNPYDDK